MRFVIGLFALGLVSACSSPGSREPGADLAPGQTAPRSDLQEELLELAADDQRYEQMVIRRDPAVEDPGFFERKERLQVERAARCEQIFNAVGYPGSSMVGEDASRAFWLLVQHADHDPQFQERVARAMVQAQREGEATGSQLAYLTDRVRVNTGRPQLYGTQVTHDPQTGRVAPKPLERPEEVDARRAEAGLEPLWAYMNGQCRLYYDMNAAPLKASGLTEAYQYEVGFTDW